jgi:hypothetical protein
MTAHSSLPPTSASTSATLPAAARVRMLQQQVPGLCGGSHFSATPRSRVSSGWPALDALLPGHGFFRGSLIEWFSEEPGSGAGSLALTAAREASQEGGAIVILDQRGWFYPPAAAAWGIDLQRLIWLRPPDEAGGLWALDQALRCRAVAAVWADLPRLESRWFRRFQLAVESSGNLGFLLRPAQVRGQPSWAEIQLGVQSRPSSSGRRWRVELLRCRGQGPRGEVEFQLEESSGAWSPFPKSQNHEAHSLSLASPLAPPKTARRSTRA